jgi:hypothetical protein
MNPDTGEIREFEHRAQAVDAGFTISLTPYQAAELLKMNRVQRRNWARRLMTESALKEIASRAPKATDEV